jgi:hypothetical protein
MKNEKKNLLVFGYGLAAIICFFIWRHSAKHGDVGPISIGFLVLAALIAIVTAINHRILKPFYDKWMIGAHFIGSVITTIILCLLFYCVFGIVGIILRIIRLDLLDEKLELERASYWMKRKKEFNRESCTKQF